MPFKLKPQPVPDNFKWNGKYFHLTYATFLPLALVLNIIQSATSTLFFYSFCHERGEPGEDDEEDEGYEHTHVALMFISRINIVGSRKFDIVWDGLGAHQDGTQFFNPPRVFHPNIQPKVTMEQLEQIWTSYHAGRKYSMKDGKMVYKAPVCHHYTLPPQFCFTRAIMQEEIAAPNLFEACIAGAVRPRTVNDIKTLREESKKGKKFKHLFDRSSFLDFAPAGFTALFAYGGSGLGKTKWACAQFDNPLFVKPFNSIGCVEKLKEFNPDTNDGIVFDEADLRFLSREQVIALVDFDEECVLDVRYGKLEMPANVKKIFVANFPPKDILPPDTTGAINRRIQPLHINGITYNTPPPLLTPATQPGATPQTQQGPIAMLSDEALAAMPMPNFGTPI